MVLYIILALSLLFLIYLLFASIIICIDTISNQYYFELKGIFKANLEKDDIELFRIKLKVLLLKFYIYPLKKRKKRMQNKIKTKAHTNSKRNITLTRIIKIINTFKVTRFVLDIDTDNCILNAKLYPLFSLFNFYGGNFHVNFQGRNQLVLYVKNRPIDIIRSIINF